MDTSSQLVTTFGDDWHYSVPELTQSYVFRWYDTIRDVVEMIRNVDEINEWITME